MAHVSDQKIKDFLATGDSDVLPERLTGDWVTAAKKEDQAMREALIAEVKRRATGRQAPKAPVLDFQAFTRSKVAPMVNGLFPEAERTNVLNMLEKSVVFLTADNIDDIIWHVTYRHSAWELANLYLLSIGAELLSDGADKILGLSIETTCYVSQEYFSHED